MIHPASGRGLENVGYRSEALVDAVDAAIRSRASSTA
jgi:hypothetical protein